MWIMIAGPYRSGAKSEADREQNLANLNRAAYELFRKGHVPVVGVNCALPLIAAAGSDAYESIMMPLSLAMADRCDAVLRLGEAVRRLPHDRAIHLAGLRSRRPDGLLARRQAPVGRVQRVPPHRGAGRRAEGGALPDVSCVSPRAPQAPP